MVTVLEISKCRVIGRLEDGQKADVYSARLWATKVRQDQLDIIGELEEAGRGSVLDEIRSGDDVFSVLFEQIRPRTGKPTHGSFVWRVYKGHGLRIIPMQTIFRDHKDVWQNISRRLHFFPLEEEPMLYPLPGEDTPEAGE